jgi:hypothetical protein
LFLPINHSVLLLLLIELEEEQQAGTMTVCIECLGRRSQYSPEAPSRRKGAFFFRHFFFRDRTYLVKFYAFREEFLLSFFLGPVIRGLHDLL